VGGEEKRGGPGVGCSFLALIFCGRKGLFFELHGFGVGEDSKVGM